MRYFKHILIASTQLLNTLTGGYPDESTSSRAWRQRDRKTRWLFIQLVIDFLFFWQDGHCEKAYLSERERRHTPPELR